MSSKKKSLYRVLIVEGMEVIRVGLAQIISAASQLLVCAATGDYDDVPDLIERHRPHLTIAEPFRQDRDGLVWIKISTHIFQRRKSSLPPRTPKRPMLNVSYARACRVTG